MKLRLLHSFCSFVVILSGIAVNPLRALSAVKTPHTTDSLYVELSKAKTPADSVVILHNLFDCVDVDERRAILYKVFETAERARDYNSMLEVLYVLTMLYQHEPDLEQKLLEMAERIPDSEIKRTNLLYIKLRYQASSLNRITEDERQHRLHQALKDYRAQESLDKYERIACLFLICTNLRNTNDSELLIHYLQQLQNIIEEFPYEEIPVRMLFYTMATDAYIDNDMFDKALAANKRRLELIAQTDKLHESQGRIFRNYDGSYYHCYHNMLVCAQELTDEEIDMYHDRIVDLIDRNPQIKSNISLQNWTRIYYFMAKKRYSEAIPLLKERLKANDNNTEAYHYANLLVKAARAVGDRESLLQGAKILNSIYRNRLMSKPDISLSEIQTIYDVEKLKDRNRDLNIENQRIEADRRRHAITTVSVAVIIAVCILIWLLSLYVRSQRLARHLSVSNKKLVEERNLHSEIYDRLVELRDKAEAADNIRSNFVENMSDEIREPLDAIVEYSRIIADYAKVDDRTYIREYADAMSVNTDLLIRLVNDILDLPQIESGELRVQPTPSSVRNICDFALGVIKKHVVPGVEIIFTNDGQHDILINTDPQRVEQVLIQVLTNAAKFTDSGSITFGYEIDPQSDTITFTVTDTGIGLPDGVEEKIFNRFVKMDPTSQGFGLGLYIGRLLANMLGGTLTLDTSYRDGARFNFTIPMN